MTRALILATAIAALAALFPGASVQAGQRDLSINKSGPGFPCMFDPERGTVPNCISETKSGSFLVASKYIPGLSFDDYGLASVYTEKTGWMYVNRAGHAVVTEMPDFDNGADYFRDGLVRTTRRNKYGYANRAGVVVIPRIYDGAYPFDRGTAVVCEGCHVTWDKSHEHSWFVGGKWYRVDAQGRIVAHLKTRRQ